jgi:hypothetical protein
MGFCAAGLRTKYCRPSALVADLADMAAVGITLHYSRCIQKFYGDFMA